MRPRGICVALCCAGPGNVQLCGAFTCYSLECATSCMLHACTACLQVSLMVRTTCIATQAAKDHRGKTEPLFMIYRVSAVSQSAWGQGQGFCHNVDINCSKLSLFLSLCPALPAPAPAPTPVSISPAHVTPVPTPAPASAHYYILHA